MHDAIIAELGKPEYAEITDEEAAAALSVLTDPTPYRMIFGSFRTLAAILDQTEYNTLRAVLKSASDTETAAGGTMLADMTAMLSLPGDSEGNGGGVALNSPGVVAMLDQFAAAVPALAEVPAKVAAYVASQQSPTKRYREIHAGDVAKMRKEMA